MLDETLANMSDANRITKHQNHRNSRHLKTKNADYIGNNVVVLQCKRVQSLRIWMEEINGKSGRIIEEKVRKALVKVSDGINNMTKE